MPEPIKAKRKPSPSPSSSSEEEGTVEKEIAEFEIGDRVWAKVKGYQWWPGFVQEVSYYADKASSQKKKKKQLSVQIRYKILFTGNTSSVGYVTKKCIKDYVKSYDEIALLINMKNKVCLYDAIINYMSIGYYSGYRPNGVKKT